MAEKCQAVTEGGKPCKAYAKEGGVFCVFHANAESAPSEPDNTGGAIYRTTRGYFGVFPIIESRIKAREADGSRRWNRSIKLSVKRLGTEKATGKPVGIVDTRALPDMTVMACEERWGKHWRPDFDKAVAGRARAMYLEKIEDTQEIVLIEKDRAGPTVIYTARTVGSMKPNLPGTKG